MLVPLLKIVAFFVVNLWSLVTRLIFNTIAHTIVLLIQGLKTPGEGAHGIFQQVAEAIRGSLEFILQQILESMTYIISLVFDIVRDGITETVTATVSLVVTFTGSVAEVIAENVQGLSEQMRELIQELADMISNMVTDLWDNYKDAVGYVVENAGNGGSD